MRRKSNISKRCMVCIMSAMMMMSSVTGTMIAPIGAYAENYNTTAEVPEDTDGHRNLASEDTLDVNDGTIHENNGIIKDNAEGATVEINNNKIEKNEGTVVTNAVGATVGTENDEVSGTVVNNYGTAEQSSVEKNYGTANNSNVINNYQSGKVTGSGSEVGINYGGYVEEGINIEVNEIIVTQNKPAETIEAAPASDTGNSNDDPTPPSVITDSTSKLDAAVNGLSDAGWNGTNIVLSGDKVLTLEKLAELECESSGYADVFGKGFKTRYEQAFLKAISEGKNVAEARTIAREAADKEIASIVKKIDDNIRSVYLTLAGLSGESVTLDENNPDYMNFVAAYNKAFWGACDEGATLEDAQRIAWRDSISVVSQNPIFNSVYAHSINKGTDLMLAVRNAKLASDAMSNYYTEEQKAKYIQEYLDVLQKSMDDNKTLSKAINDAQLAAEQAVQELEHVNDVNPEPTIEGLQEKLKKQEEEAERRPQTAAITNANAAIAPVNGAMAGDKEVFVPYIYLNEAEWDEATMREIANQSDPGMSELVYQDMKEKKGKWIRYDQNGKIVKGWITIEGDLAEKYPNQVGNTYYYDTVTGTMARGRITIDGVTHYFNEITGVLER